MATAKPPGEKKPPSWVGDRLVGCADGPMVGQWFTHVEWQARVEAARYMHENKGQRRAVCLDYVPDGTLTHPEWPQAIGAAMRHRPGGKKP